MPSGVLPPRRGALLRGTTPDAVSEQETMGRFDYERKKERERAFYAGSRDRPRGLAGRILLNPLLYNPERIAFSYVFPKRQMADVVGRILDGTRVDKMLFAPCGTGGDFEYVGRFARQAFGIDLSPVAVKRCPPEMDAKVGDILESGYPDATFDIVVSSAFFHHVLGIGFDPFLREFARVLKEGGKVVIMEPSLWYPLNIVTRPIKRLFRNPFGEVEDEAPFRPSLMLDALERAGFREIGCRGATFSHCSFFIPLAKLVNRISGPLLSLGPCARLAWWVIYWAEKGRS